jgi:predicted  nucleic acid-binding Zn-ribbon protein
VTKAEQVYDRIEAMVASGESKADAFKALAKEFGQPVNSVRGSYYAHHKKVHGGSTRPRRRETTPADAVEDAKAALTRSIERIDAEIEAAENRASEAQAELSAMKDSAGERRKAIEAKLAALDA